MNEVDAVTRARVKDIQKRSRLPLLGPPIILIAGLGVLGGNPENQVAGGALILAAVFLFYLSLKRDRFIGRLAWEEEFLARWEYPGPPGAHRTDRREAGEPGGSHGVQCGPAGEDVPGQGNDNENEYLESWPRLAPFPFYMHSGQEPYDVLISRYGLWLRGNCIQTRNMVIRSRVDSADLVGNDEEALFLVIGYSRPSGRKYVKSEFILPVPAGQGARAREIHRELNRAIA